MGTGWSQDEASQSQPCVQQSTHSQNPTETNPFESKAKAIDDTSEAKPNGNKTKEAEKALKAIHKLDEITKDSDTTVDYSTGKLLTKLQDGILLNQKRKASLMSTLANFSLLRNLNQSLLVMGFGHTPKTIRMISFFFFFFFFFCIIFYLYIDLYCT